MTPHPLVSRFLRPACAAVFALGLTLSLLAAEPVKKSFNLPAGDAAATLKAFTQQSGEQIVYPVEQVRGVRTNPVRGELSTRAALDQMLDGTGLVVVQDEKTGALAVKKDPLPNAPRVAQTDGDHPGHGKVEGGKIVLDTYEVVGSKIDGLNNKSLFRTDEKAPLPFSVISREEIERMGASSIQEVFRALPQVSNYGFSDQANATMTQTVGGDTTSNDSVGLRGFANSQTVILVNGRRLNGVLALSNLAAFAADISKIPVAMIDRIEVLPASAGAIYGGGGIGGAINVILRKNYNAKEITTYYGTSTDGGGARFHLTYLQGLTFNQGKDRLTVVLDYDHRNAVKAYQRGYYQRALEKYAQNPYEVISGRNPYETYILPVFASTPGTIVTAAAPGTASGAQLNIPGNPTARFAGIPAGLTNAQALALTPASFTATAGLANLAATSRFGQINLYSPNQTTAWNVDYEHVFRPEKLAMFFECSGSIARLRQQYPSALSLSLSATHPLNPFRTNVTPGFVGVAVRYYFDDPDIPLSETIQDRDDLRAVFGFKGKVGSKWEWTLDVAGQYTRTYVVGTAPDYRLSSILTRAGLGDPGYTGTPVVTGGPASPTTPLSFRWTNVYNPFLDHTRFPIPADTIANYFQTSRLGINYERSTNLEGRVVGRLLELPAGPLYLSPGFDIQLIDEITRSLSFFAPGLTDPAIYGDLAANNGALTQNAHSSLSNKAYYVETTIPVIGGHYHPIPLHSLELGASARTDRPNHSRAASTSTFSGQVALTADIALRASLTEGYALLSASNYAEPTTRVNVTTTIIDPMRGNASQTIVIPTQLSGGNPALKAQSGRARNIGVILTPRWLKNFAWQLDYWRIRQYNTNAVPNLPQMLLTPENYPGRVERGPLTAADQALGYTGGPILSVDLTRINIAQINTDGFDSRLSYRWRLPRPEWGELSLATNTTFTNAYRRQDLPIGPKLNIVGINSGNTPLRWKGYAQLGWRRDTWNVSVMANYIDRFKATTTTPSVLYPTASGVDGEYIPSMTTFNLAVGRRLPAKAGGKGWRSWISGTDWTVGCLNIFNRQPPLVSDSQGFYSKYADPRQRYVYVQVKKDL